MRKIVQITNVLMRIRASPELEITDHAFGDEPAKIAREASIPRAFLLADLREKRTFRRLARKLAGFIMLVVFYATALLLDRNITTRFNIGQVLSKELLETSLSPSGVTFATGITSVDAFWDWFGNTFVPMVYATTTSSGLPIPSELRNTIGVRSKILGGFNIVQHRYLAINTSSLEHKHSLCYSTIAAGKDMTCYSASGASTEAFGSVEAAGSTGSEEELRSLEMFQYSVNSEGVGGFQTYFLRSSTGGAAELARAKRMQAYGWIGPQTRRVDITIPIYNIHLKMAGVVLMRLESNLAGEVKGTSSIRVMSTEPYNLNVPENVVRVVCELIYVSFVVIFAGSELWEMLVVSRGNFRQYSARHGVFETLSELVSISVNLMIIASRYAIMASEKRRMFTTASSFDTYAPLTAFTNEDDVYIGLNTFNVMVLALRVLTYFRVTSGGARLINSIAGAMPDILSFLPMYIAVIVAYAFAGHVLFGLTFAEWSTFKRAVCRVIEMNFGLYDPSAIYDASDALGFIFTASSSVVFCIIMLNVFLAIIMSTWDAFTEKEVEKAKVRERYRAKMSVSELVALVLTCEAVLDALIRVVLHMDEHVTVTRELFEHHWRAQETRIPEYTRCRVLKWYWNSDDGSALVGPNAQHANAAHVQQTHPESPLSSPSLNTLQQLRTKSAVNEVTPLHEQQRHTNARVAPT